MILKTTRKNLRWTEFDYAQDAIYFITSVTYNRKCFFGNIREGKMYKSTAGNLAERQWFWLAEQYPYVILHEFVVMPNHVHGIIEIRRRDRSRPVHPSRMDGLSRMDDLVRMDDLSRLDDPMRMDDPLRMDDLVTSVPTGAADRSRPVPTGKTLPQLIGAYKTTSSKAIHLAGRIDFRWQRSYYDRVIRNDDEFYFISDYIKTNPQKWADDRYSKS